ncbi:hypothetical protein G4228_001546 [Cervus hanglu yarkandensis]|nr:hypothetical protein G4228_001546 [Cervus hanglu yarkandensis]
MLGDGAVLLLLLLPWTAQGRAVSEAGGPAWARGQQLSRQLCVLAWRAHPPMGHVSCLQRIHQGLVFYEKLLGSDIFTGEPSLLPDGPVDQLHASVLGLRELLQPEGHHWETEQTPSPTPSQPWQRLLLRLKILRSLQAFVAVAARVFAHGAATLSP